MVQNVKLYFHSFTLLTYISGIVWQLAHLRNEKPENRYVADIIEYGERYFTLWNLVIHFIYFSLALSEDINDQKVFISRKSLVRLKAYIFSTLLFPWTAFVCVVFWGYYFYDRELIFPKEAEYYCTKYTNHVVHTSIGIFAVLEIFLTGDHPEVSFNSCFFTTTATCVVYYTLFFYHYLTLGRFLYPLYEALNWYQFGMLITIFYLWFLLVSKIGLTVQKYIRKTKLPESQD